MVIKGSAARRDGERLHPAAEVEQEAKKGIKGDGGKRTGCVGARTARKKKRKKASRERAREKGKTDRFEWRQEMKGWIARVTVILVALPGVVQGRMPLEWK